MVKYIKPKPLSKRELKDIQRSPNINSPQMQALSPAMPFPNSPFLDDNGCSLVESPSKDKVRNQRSGTMKAARERILPRARKSGGRHKPIAIPSTPSPPRTPIIPSDTDSGCESELTAMINSAKNRIRQSADKMREDGSKLQKLKASNTGDSLLDEATKSDQYLSPGRKRRVNLLRKKASGSPCISRSPSIAVSGSGSSPVFSISFGDPSSSFEVLLHSSASSSSQLAAPTPRTFMRSKANSREQNTRTLGTTSGPNKGMPFDEKGQVTLTLRSFTAADMVKYGMAGLGLSATNVLEMTFEPDSATKESKEVPAEGTENRGEAKKKPKSRKKKKKRARSRAVSVSGSPALPANPVAEQEPSASRGTSPKPSCPPTPVVPIQKDTGTRSRANSPNPKPENPDIGSEQRSKVSSPVPEIVRNRTPSSTPQPTSEESKTERRPPTREEVKRVIKDLRAVRTTADRMPQSKSGILRSYMTAMDTYRRVFDSSEAGGLALASSQSGKLADMLSNYANSGGAAEDDVDGILRRPFGVVGERVATQKPRRMNDGQKSMVRPGGDTPKPPLAMSVGRVTQTISDVDMEAGGREFLTDVEGGLMVRDKRNMLMRKVTSFVRSVTTVFLSPWKVFARALEGTGCV